MQWCSLRLSSASAFAALFAAANLIAGGAGYALRAPAAAATEAVQLRTASTATSPAVVAAVVADQRTTAATTATVAAALGNWRMPSTGINAGNTDGDGSGQEEQQEQQPPVSMQVPEEEVEAFVGKLSPSCKKRFSAILAGDGPSLEAFGAPVQQEGTEGPAAAGGHGAAPEKEEDVKASCENLHGSICITQAHVEQEQAAPLGRQMRSSVDISGKGCWPRECVEKEDLKHLAGLMRAKAKETIPGMGASVELHVNCTGSGGSKVALGVNEGHSSDKSSHGSGGAAAATSSGNIVMAAKKH